MKHENIHSNFIENEGNYVAPAIFQAKAQTHEIPKVPPRLPNSASAVSHVIILQSE